MRNIWLSLLMVLIATDAFAVCGGSYTGSSPGTITAYDASCDCINAAIAASNDGDIVSIPSGTCTPTDANNIVIDNKAITLKGSDSGKTVIVDNTTNAWLENAVYVRFRAAKTIRVSNIRFLPGTDNSDYYGFLMAHNYGCSYWGTFILDHCEFGIPGTGLDLQYGFTVRGPVNGVAYSNSFWRDNVSSTDSTHFYNVDDLAADVSCEPTNTAGEWLWKNTVTSYGTPTYWFYVEGNTFGGTDAGVMRLTTRHYTISDSDMGARIVFRYNDTINSSLVNHGHDGNSSTHIGNVASEIYNNSFNMTNTADHTQYALSFRSGTGIISKNTFTGRYDEAIYLANFCTDGGLGNCPANIWGSIYPVTYPTGYPWLNQVGWSPNGDGTLGQHIDPMYITGNTIYSGITPTYSPSDSALMIAQGREYVYSSDTSTSKPGYSAYRCPHPLTGYSGSCDSSSVGVSAYNTGGATYTIGGSLSGLSGTLVLQNNGGDNLTLTNNGAFTFATAINNGLTYSVTVLTQPTGQTCTVSNGSGTVSGADVTNVSVACTSLKNSIGINGGNFKCNGCSIRIN